VFIPGIFGAFNCDLPSYVRCCRKWYLRNQVTAGD